MTFNNAVLIPSCDKYSDLWEPFFDCFWKNWPNCPYNVYLSSNFIKLKKDQRVKHLLAGHDVGWGGSLKKILRQIPERYLFIWNEDLFFTSKIDNSRFEEGFNLLKKYKAKHIHYRCLPKAPRYTENGLLGIYDKGMPYCVNETGFWDKNYLTKLLIDGEYSWDFEIMGSYRASYDEGFYCFVKPLFTYVHLCEKGKWKRDSVNYCLKHGIKIDLSSRPLSTSGYLDNLRDLYFNFLLNKNWRLRVKIMYLLKKILISY